MADDNYDLTPNSDRGYRRTIDQIMDKSNKKSSSGDSSGSSDSSSSSSSSSDSSSEDDYEEKKDTVITTGMIDTYKKALDFAKWYWHKIQRDNGRTVQLQTWGMTIYQPGEWARVYLPSFNIDNYMYITNASHSNDGGDWTCNLTLVDFPPGWGKEEKEKDKDKDDDDSGSASSSKIDRVIGEITSEIGKFSYSGSCSDSKCIKSSKKGDCWALSAYIYNRLTKEGISARIYQYKTSSSNQHRQVKYKDGSDWVMFPYSKSGIDHNFYTNEIPSKAKKIKG